MATLEGAGYAARLAGGCVRDRLMGHTPKDYDIATDAVPDHVIKVFERTGARAIPTGIDHGTVTVVHAGIPIEITTLRKDVATDGRRAVVKFGKSFEEDAERRDFTINAMFEDREGVIYDYFQGRNHLTEKRLVFVGDADRRIREDFLRILRLFRFCSRFGFSADKNALQAASRHVSGLAIVSQERITSELIQILAGSDVENIVKLMQENGVLAAILPEFGQIKAADHGSIGQLLTLPDAWRPIGILAIIAKNAELTKPIAEIGARLRLSSKQCDAFTLFTMSGDTMKLERDDRASRMAIIDHTEQTLGNMTFHSVAAPVWRLVAKDPDTKKLVDSMVAVERQFGSLRRMAPPISADVLVRELAMKPGPALGETLRKLKASFRNGEWTTVAEGLAILSQK